MRTTATGDVVWKRWLSSSSTDIFVPAACGVLDAESVFVAGHVWTGNYYGQFLAKIGLDGTFLWLIRYDLPEVVGDYPYLVSAAKVPGGVRAVFNGYDSIWIAQVSDEGDVQWCRRVSVPFDFDPIVEPVMAIDTAGLQVISCTLVYAFGNIHIPWVFCISPGGEVVWERAYDLGVFAEVCAIGPPVTGLCAGWLNERHDRISRL
ncbi:MAG: hypothetical protein IPO90_04915 [Flavobacteriales bacterium]|nr:hypothetical protein [Flavobacteriales bacterium]